MSADYNRHFQITGAMLNFPVVLTYLVDFRFKLFTIIFVFEVALKQNHLIVNHIPAGEN